METELTRRRSLAFALALLLAILTVPEFIPGRHAAAQEGSFAITSIRHGPDGSVVVTWTLPAGHDAYSLYHSYRDGEPSGNLLRVARPPWARPYMLSERQTSITLSEQATREPGDHYFQVLARLTNRDSSYPSAGGSSPYSCPALLFTQRSAVSTRPGLTGCATQIAELVIPETPTLAPAQATAEVPVVVPSPTAPTLAPAQAAAEVPVVVPSPTNYLAAAAGPSPPADRTPGLSPSASTGSTEVSRGTTPRVPAGGFRTDGGTATEPRGLLAYAIVVALGTFAVLVGVLIAYRQVRHEERAAKHI